MKTVAEYSLYAEESRRLAAKTARPEDKQTLETIGLAWEQVADEWERFATAAEAIRFAFEDFPAVRTLGAWMRVGDEQFNSDDIQRLYDSSSYPRRRVRKSTRTSLNRSSAELEAAKTSGT